MPHQTPAPSQEEEGIGKIYNLDRVETHLQLFIGVHVKTIALWASVHGQEAQTFQRSPALSCHPDSLVYPFS